MACCHTWFIKNKNYRGYPWEKEYYEVPCGHCVNCMADKKRDLEIRCNYEYLKYKGNSFITLTYDDENIPVNENGINTLVYKDVQLFFKRLRDLMDRENINNEYLRRDFKYLAVGEYGDTTKRCHYHILIFGMDFQEGKILYEKSWGKGIVDSLPIKAGGISYVLKYLQKSLNSKAMRELYDDNNIERPFEKHSKGLGRELYEEQKDYILSHNGTINFRGKEVPINRYYKNKMLCDTWEDKTEIKRQMKEIKIKPLYEYPREYTEEQIRDFVKSNALRKERKMIYELRSKGQPMEDPSDYIN